MQLKSPNWPGNILQIFISEFNIEFYEDEPILSRVFFPNKNVTHILLPSDVGIHELPRDLSGSPSPQSSSPPPTQI